MTEADLESTVVKVCDKVLKDDDEPINVRHEGSGNAEQGINGNLVDELGNKGNKILIYKRT